mmetsp:Transcript_48030/g.104587  ORF Transcript_48030/g.104587 Transcript_48030/m.104587 type:complete len:503 (-) Transcript_48030:617-2125(-)
MALMARLEYFDSGSRPFLLQFPPCVSRLSQKAELKTQDVQLPDAVEARVLQAKLEDGFVSAWKRSESCMSQASTDVGSVYGGGGGLVSSSISAGSFDLTCNRTWGSRASVTEAPGMDSEPLSPGPLGFRRQQPMRREETKDYWLRQDSGASQASMCTSSSLKAPSSLESAFDPSWVKAWEADRYKTEKMLQEAPRNKGEVYLVKDTVEEKLLAAKRMPTRWARTSHSAFTSMHPEETEFPWTDIGCTKFLNDVGYPFACRLHGVYRDSTHTFVLSSYASEGDLFKWACYDLPAKRGPEREQLARPVIIDVALALRDLHMLSIAHRDVSIENILRTKDEWDQDQASVRLIDFGAASTRRFRRASTGKASYQAPEMHSDQDGYDAYLCDAFALGVAMYVILCKDYPWMSTKPGECKCFAYVKRHGFRAFANKRKLPGTNIRVSSVMSESALQLLEGLLAFDPLERIGLGDCDPFTEEAEPDCRRSIWDEPWLKEALNQDESPIK